MQTNFNDVSAIISSDSWRRKETVSYPGSSLREAILNAFCHSNYFIRSNIKIEFFDDRVKITNPGGIYQATLEQIMSGVQTYRNPGLANILSKLHYIENFGTGIPRILPAYKGADKQHVFNPSGNFFMLTLPNQNYADPVNDPVNDPINDPIKIKDDRLGDLELIILQTIQQNPGINTRNLLKLINEKQPEITLDTLKNNIKRKLQDYIEFRGSQKKGGYFIKERNQ